MNKEQLRLKLIEAWSNGWIRLAIENEDDWGFQILDECVDELESFLGLSFDTFHYDTDFDEFSRSVALEISSWPLNQALT